MSRKPANAALIFVITALFMCSDIMAATVGSDSEIAESTRETLEQLEYELNHAILSKDKAALDRFLSDDCTTGGNVVLSKSEHIDQIMTTSPPKSQTLDSISVKIYGDTAVVTGLATAEMLSPAGAWSDTIRRVNVWVHGENGWQVVYIQSTKVGLFPADGC